MVDWAFCLPNDSKTNIILLINQRGDVEGLQLRTFFLFLQTLKRANIFIST